jgi:hypothetical protein
MIENKNKLNIKEIILSEPAKKIVSFDPEKDLTDKDWQDMEAHFHSSDIRDCETLSLFKTAFPDRSIEISKLVRENLERNIKNNKKQGLNRINVLPYFHLKTIYGDNVDISSEWDDYKEYFELLMRNQERTVSIEQNESPQNALALVVLLPKRKDEILTEPLRQLIKNQRLTKKLEHPNHIISGNKFNLQIVVEWESLSSSIVAQRLLFPKDFDERGISEAGWGYFKGALEAYRTGSWSNFRDAKVFKHFIRIACNLKILASADAKITERGIMLTDKKPEIDEEVPKQVPERRKF